MFEVYVDKPLPSSETAPRTHGHEPLPHLTKLTVSCGATVATLSARLNFESFAGLKGQIEALVPSLAEFEEGAGWLVFSLQFCTKSGGLVTLLPSTYDPSDFGEPSDKVYLRATVAPKPSSVPGTERAKSGAPPRRALGRRDENTLPAGAARGTRHGAAASKATPARKAATAAPAAKVKHTATPTAAKAARPPPPTTSQRSKAAAAAITSSSTPRQQLHVRSSNTGRGCRAPAYVFKAVGAGSSGSEPSSKRETFSKVPLPGRRQRERPGWNSGNEPAWEEAERKKAAMRKAARARILGKRAAAAAKQARVHAGAGGGKGGAGRGGKARVFRRAKRDCRVVDTRRKKVAAYLFCDPIGALPPAVGKRNLETFRNLGRAAAAQMKYVAIGDEDSAPKRGRGEASTAEQGRAFVVFPRGDAQQQRPPMVGTGPAAAAAATGAGATSTDDAHAPPKATPFPLAQKRVVVAASKSKPMAKATASSFPTPAKKAGGGAAARAPSALLPTALRPPTARPGDIGFFRGGVGFRMRPPSTPAAAAAAAAGVPAAAPTATAAATPRSRGGGGGGGGGGWQGAAALTAAAAAKVRARAASASSAQGSASIRGSARQRGRGGGAVAAYKEAKGSRAAQEDAAAAAAIMAKLAGGGRGKGKGRAGGGGGADTGEGGDVESLQEQVALLKAAAGLSDEELTWRMETAKPEANAYRIAAAALQRAETIYERLLWRQGQLEIARARLTGRGVGGDAATAAFAAAVSRVAAAAAAGSTLLPQDGASNSNSSVLSRLGTSSEAVLATVQEPPTTATAAAALPADVAAGAVRAAAAALAKLVAAVKATATTGTEVDYAAVMQEVAAESGALKDLADGFGRDLAALGRRVEDAVGQMEAWQQRKAEAPEFAAEEAAREEAWNEANREANESALREMRALLPEAVWDMNALDIQAAAAAAATASGSGSASGSDASRAAAAGGVFYPFDLCVRLRECRPLHWLVSTPEDIAGANFLAGDGAAAFTQLEGMDVVEMRAVWSVLPREFCRDGDGKKAEWRARFRQQLEGLARQQDGVVVTAGWDPVRSRRATTRMPPLPANRARHPAYSYPTLEAMESRVARLREQRRRLAARKERLSVLEAELAEAKAEVDSACADARSGELRKRYGAETLRSAREAAKEAHSALLRERKSLSSSVAEAEKVLSSTFPSLEQLESEVQSIEQTLGRASTATNTDNNPNSNSNGTPEASSSGVGTVGAAEIEKTLLPVRVPGAFSEEPELRRRSVTAARKLSPEEERRLRAGEVQRAVSSRDAGPSGVGSTTGATAAAAAADAIVAGGGGDSGAAALDQPVQDEQRTAAATAAAAAAAVGPAATLATPAAAAAVPAAPGVDECVAGAPPPRRPVKVAPGVLALLTKQHSARALAAGGGGGSGASEETKTKTKARTKVGEGTEPGSYPPVAAPPAAERASAKQPAGQPAKPISKSLAALIARKKKGSSSDGLPPRLGSSDGDGACSEDKRVGGGVGLGLGQKVASPALGFLGELKAKAAARNGNGCPGPSPPLPLPPTVAAPAPAPRGGSFLDELKARTARIS